MPVATAVPCHVSAEALLKTPTTETSQLTPIAPPDTLKVTTNVPNAAEEQVGRLYDRGGKTLVMILLRLILDLRLSLGLLVLQARI